MTQDAQSDGTPTVSAPMRCPYYPGANALWTPAPALAAAADGYYAGNGRSFLRAVAQNAPHSTVAESHAGRGPPAEITA
jgi:hypothetical protein